MQFGRPPTRSARGPASACSPAIPPLRSQPQPFCSGGATSRTRTAQARRSRFGRGRPRRLRRLEEPHTTTSTTAERSPRPVGNHVAVPPRPGGRSLHRRPDVDRRRAQRRNASRAGLRLRAIRRSTASTSTRRSATSRRSTRISRSGSGEREVAIAQASRFSQVCRVYAPVYRQITLSALEHPARITLADALIAYDSVLSAFRDYLAHYNHGRGIVFIGHSQGASILIKLLKEQVDAKPALRRRLVSALLLGRQRHRRARGAASAATSTTSRSAARARRPVASSPTRASRRSRPQNSQFGRTTSDAGVQPPRAAQPVAEDRDRVREPGRSRRRTGRLDPYVPSLVLAVPRRRQRAAGADALGLVPGRIHGALQVVRQRDLAPGHPHGGSPDQRPLLAELRDPALGLHILDVNIALGNLVRLVRDEAAAYRG